MFGARQGRRITAYFSVVEADLCIVQYCAICNSPSVLVATSFRTLL